MTNEDRAPGRAQGRVIDALPSALFLVELDSKEQIVAHVSGGPTRNFVRIREGDRGDRHLVASTSDPRADYEPPQLTSRGER